MKSLLIVIAMMTSISSFANTCVKDFRDVESYSSFVENHQNIKVIDITAVTKSSSAWDSESGLYVLDDVSTKSLVLTYSTDSMGCYE